MRPATDLVLDADATVDRTLQSLDEKSPEVLLVRLNPTGWSSVTKQELEGMTKEGKGGETLASARAGREIPYLRPDHPLETALRYVDRWPLVPVVNRAEFRKLEGVVSEHDVLTRYRDFGAG